MKKVYLAVGHGHKDDGTFDPGAVGGGWTEQNAGDIIVKEAAKVLAAAGFDVRDEAFKDDPNFPGTTRAANAWGPDLVVEVHHDWVGAPVGAFGHWYTKAGKTAADAIQLAVGRSHFPLRPSWHKRRTDLYILKNTKAPCVLYEVGKIGQVQLNSPHELRMMGRAIATGIMNHFGVSVQDTNENEEYDVAEVEKKLDQVLKILGDRNTRPSMWRDVDRTKQATGELVLAVQGLPNRIADAIDVAEVQIDAADIVDEIAVKVVDVLMQRLLDAQETLR